MKFRLFTKNKQPKETVDIESGFAEICNRYESKLRELCIDWEELTKKSDLLFESLDEAVKNDTHTEWLDDDIPKAFRQVIDSLIMVKKSIKKELKKLNKTVTKEQTELLRKTTKIWLEEVLGTSELSRGLKFLLKKKYSLESRNSRKLDELLEKKNKALKAASQQRRMEQIEHQKVEQERNLERFLQFQQAEEIRLTCKTCRHTPSEREEQVRLLVSLNLSLIKNMASEQRTRKREEGMANALKWNMKFGEAALVEMNSRQRERTQIFEPARCPECQFPFFGRYG